MSLDSSSDLASRQSKQRRRLIAASSAVVTNVIGLVTMVTIVRLRASRALANHTLEVLQWTEALSSHLSDAETGQRGYLITNDTNYLEPYHAGRSDIDRDTTALRDLTRDNPEQQRRLDALGVIVRRKFGEMEAHGGAATRRAGDDRGLHAPDFRA